jgi:hypothetical protein
VYVVYLHIRLHWHRIWPFSNTVFCSPLISHLVFHHGLFLSTNRATSTSVVGLLFSTDNAIRSFLVSVVYQQPSIELERESKPCASLQKEDNDRLVHSAELLDTRIFPLKKLFESAQVLTVCCYLRKVDAAVQEAAASARKSPQHSISCRPSCTNSTRERDAMLALCPLRINRTEELNQILPLPARGSRMRLICQRKNSVPSVYSISLYSCIESSDQKRLLEGEDGTYLLYNVCCVGLIVCGC